MFKPTVRKCVLTLPLLFIAANSGSAWAAPSTSQFVTPQGVTPTDPEPIEPGFISILLSLLSLT
jgi:hypothetical protein